MYKLFILITIFFLAIINLYSQRNDGNRGGNVDSGRIPRLERKPVQTNPITTIQNGIVKTRNPGTITYPKTPVKSNPVRSGRQVIEDRPIQCIVVSPGKYDPPPVPEIVNAMELFTLGDYWESSKAFTSVLVNNPFNKNALLYRGRCYLEIEWYGFAIEDFDLLIDLDPEHAEAYYFRGLARFFRNEKHLAQIDFEIALELGHRLAGVFLNKYF